MNLPEQRLMTIAEAAQYCRLPRALFQTECDVQPIRFGPNTLRYDRQDVDAWIERRKGGHTEKTFEDWRAKLRNGDGRKGARA